MQQVNDLLYQLNDKPSFGKSLTAALQHVMASFVGIITPTLILGAALGLGPEVPYLISMALLVSGIATFIQVRTIGPLGCGLIAVQGTSFAFISALLVAGTMVKERGGSHEDILAMILGISFWGALIEIILSRFIDKIRRIITPLTTGIVITTIGLSLIKVGMTDLAGGFGASNFGSTQNLSIGGLVLCVIIVLNSSRSHWLRLAAIFIGMIAGTILAWIYGMVDFSHLKELPLITFPQPLKYGFSFDIAVFVPVAMVYFLTAIETSGDLTANSLFCGLPIKGPAYFKRIKGGILADGVNSMLAAVMNTFPNTTFGQNNAVIQMTGVASRHVGIFVAVILMILGLFPVIGGILQAIPKPVLGGATLVMFATVAVAGLRILGNEPMDRRNRLIIATSLGLGIGTMMVPEITTQMPVWCQYIFASAVSTAGFCAIILSLVLPQPTQEELSAYVTES